MCFWEVFKKVVHSRTGAPKLEHKMENKKEQKNGSDNMTGLLKLRSNFPKILWHKLIMNVAQNRWTA